MARSKWISIGAKVQLERAAKAAVTASAIPPTVQLDSDAKKIGLENFGNTCYANSVLQALYFCTPFRDLLLTDVDADLMAPVAPALQTSSPVIPPAATKVASPLVPQRWRPERKPSTSPQGPEPLPTISAPNAAVPSPPLPPTLFSALQSLYLSISQSSSEKGTIAPRAFIDKLKELNPIFRSTMHQDAHEFLNYLLNQIMEEIGEERKQAHNTENDLSNSVVTLGSKITPTVLTATASSNSGTHPSDATLVHKLFEGVLTSETRCLTCETVSSRDESFLDLSIDIEQNSSVTACLRQFSASETLCQRNKFFCDSCCDLQEAEKRMKIKKLPNVLALHLKRFKYQEEADRYIKLSYRVAFPFELRLFNTVDDMDDADRLYNLFAIVVHIGNGPHHGHYVSIIKTVGTWLVFDDDNVYPIPESDIPKYFGDSAAGSAYVLYYQAVDMDLSSIGLRSAAPTPPDAFVNNMPSLSRSSNPNSQGPILPPGLHNHSPGGIDTQGSHSSNPFDDPITPVQPVRSTIFLQSVPIPTPSTTDLAPSPHIITVGDSTNTPTIGNTILRHMPSFSGTRGIMTTPNSPVIVGKSPDKSPRPSISTPSFVTSIIGSSNEEVPPLPPLPPSAVNPPPPLLTTTLAPPQESEKDTKSKSPVGWFKKRKSIRIGDKASKAEASLTKDLSTSPALTEELEPHSAPQNGHHHSFLHPLRRHTEYNLSSHTPLSQHPEEMPSQTMVPSGIIPGMDANHLPEDSGSSTPSTASLRHNVQGSSNGTSGSVLEHPPGRFSSLSKSADLRTMAGSATLSHVQSSTQSSSPPNIARLPTTPVRGHRANISSGNFFTNGADAVLLTNQHVPSTPDGEAARNVTYATLSPPPSSMAASAGANLSSGSNNSASSNFKRATRKLSITAPMLGFGRRDKDKEKDKASRF